MEALTAKARALKNKQQREYMREYRKNMTEEQKARRREYKRQWDATHRENNRAAQARYWNRQAELITGGGE